MSDRVRARIRIAGKVQGVFFRAETRAEAVALNLDGSVMNVTDGTVEAVFEGEREDVERAVEWCRHGPPGARVDELQLSWEETTGQRGFSIRH